MESETTYMIGVVAAGAAVTFAMRALPFLLFAGRGGALPPWVERFGAAASPVIIAALVVYSYSGLAWLTPWPYLAGAFTVALHLWRRNALASILAGTALYMALLTAGCASAPVGELSFDAEHPLFRVSDSGFMFNGKYADPKEAANLLERHGIPKDATIHVSVDPGYSNERALWVFQHNVLNRAGYSRVIFVHPRKAESKNLGHPNRW